MPAEMLEIKKELIGRRGGRRHDKKHKFIGHIEDDRYQYTESIYPHKNDKLVEMPISLGKSSAIRKRTGFKCVEGTNFRVFMLHKQGELPVVIKVPRVHMDDVVSTHESLKKDKIHFQELKILIPDISNYLRTEWWKIPFSGNEHHVRADFFEFAGEKNLAEHRFRKIDTAVTAFEKLVKDCIMLWNFDLDPDPKLENWCIDKWRKVRMVDLDRFGISPKLRHPIQIPSQFVVHEGMWQLRKRMFGQNLGYTAQKLFVLNQHLKKGLFRKLKDKAIDLIESIVEKDADKNVILAGFADGLTEEPRRVEFSNPVSEIRYRERRNDAFST